ncbi:hypothetical protein AB733_22935 [Photobacterium swingsii]|uniref:Uncharacterized protein n=1 Tax=Photobacterium swingsii TaxID=680026 RepID=A0A0J8V524_9GAMM|nr:hypothetical protein [Photobacterium swingsii]KMV28538.1 hypothetical protein AB733_22935 [Photobacterium swingsii]PSW24504.1 hypothetical protein C9I94_10735 [Photobacterium swingsii]
MPVINLMAFAGERPKQAPRSLPNEYSTKALDCDYPVGNLEPYKKPKVISEKLSSVNKTIFKYEDKWWFKWESDVDVVLSPIDNDPWGRVYFTSKQGLRVTNNQIFNGKNDLPAASFPLGVPSPKNGVNGVVVPPTPKPAKDEAEDDETRFYVFTYVTEQGEESAQSPLSNQLEIKYPSSEVKITFPPQGKLPGNVTKRRLYRSGTGGGVSDFYKVGDYNLATLNIIDKLEESELGETLQSRSFEPPNKAMNFLTLMPNGILVGGYKNNVCFSEPYLLHAFPPEYQQTTEHEIVAMESVSNLLLVGTKGYPWIFQGTSSDAMSGRKLESMQACVSKRSMRNIDNLIIYASPHGLCAFTGDDVKLITSDVINSSQWEAMKPETIEAYYYDGKYLAFYGDNLDKSFTYNPDTGSLNFYSFGTDLGYTDLFTGKFYMRSEDGKSIAKWNNGAIKDYVWRSKEYYGLLPTFNTLYVRAKDISLVGLRIIVDGKVIHTYTEGSLKDKPVRIPPKRGNTWQFEIFGTGIVEQVCIATSMAEVYG